MAHGQAATPGRTPYAPGRQAYPSPGARPPSAEGTANVAAADYRGPPPVAGAGDSGNIIVSGKPRPDCRVSGAPVVQALQEFVSCELDFLVAPFGRPILACDDAHAVDTAEVSIDERVPGLGVVAGPLGEPEMPLGVFLPRVRLQERVLFGGSWLDLAPVAVEHDLTAVDELPRPRHSVGVHRVGSHDSILPGRDGFARDQAGSVALATTSGRHGGQCWKSAQIA